MDDIINKYQQQLDNYKQLQLCVAQQRTYLTELNDKNFQEETHNMETLMNEIKKLDRSIKKEHTDKENTVVINQFLGQIKTLAADIQKINTANTLLLKNRMDFIRFNINVATQAVAGASYKPDGDTANSTRKIKMFDQSI